MEEADGIAMPAPKLLESVLRFLLPPASREHVLGDLQERYKSLKSYLIDALSVIPPVIVSRIRRTTDLQAFLIEAFTVYCSFTMTAWYLAAARISLQPRRIRPFGSADNYRCRGVTHLQRLLRSREKIFY